jgi:dTMP kinase
MSGKFIVLEGIDGSGKSTQAGLVCEYLRMGGHEVLFTREPGGCPISEKIREIILDKNNAEMEPLTEAYLYAAARAQHVREVIAPALAQGKTVVCDRFVHSSYAYQGYGREMGVDTVKELNRLALNDVKIDLVILFNLSVDASLARVGDERDRLESGGDAFMRRVREGYLALADDSFLVVDAGADAEEIHREIVKRIRGTD